MPDTTLNPDALEAVIETLDDKAAHYSLHLLAHEVEDIAKATVSAYLAVAQPEVTGEQVNLAGWTCNGIHEPGDYSTCEECRDACDDLARFYNHMMRNPRPFKHWTGSPEVKP